MGLVLLIQGIAESSLVIITSIYKVKEVFSYTQLDYNLITFV